MGFSKLDGKSHLPFSHRDCILVFMNDTNTTALIRVADVRKTFNTIGEVRWQCVFMACEGNWTVCNIRSEHKSEASAVKKLDKLKAQYGHRFAPSFVGSK